MERKNKNKIGAMNNNNNIIRREELWMCDVDPEERDFEHVYIKLGEDKQ